MHRQYRARLTYVVAAIYAATMLVGQGWHLLACAHDHTAELHHSTVGYAARAAGSAVSMAGCTADGVHGETAAAGQADIACQSDSQQTAGHSAHRQHSDDCPICQFHSQGQMAAPAVELSVAPLTGGDAVSFVPPGDCCVRVAVYSSRAPPRG